MPSFARSRFAAALPPALSPRRAALTPSLFRLLREVGHGPGDGTHLIDPMCGGSTFALYAALLGYRVTAGDALPHARAAARFLLGLSGPLGTLDLGRSAFGQYDGFLPEAHLNALTSLLDSRREQPRAADALTLLVWKAAAGLLPGGVFGNAAVSLTSRLAAHAFDELPGTQDAQVRRGLMHPLNYLRPLSRLIVAPTTARSHTVSEVGEAGSLIRDAAGGVLILDPTQPYTRPSVISAQNTWAHFLMDDGGPLNPDSGEVEIALSSLDALIAQAGHHPCVAVILDGQQGRVTPGMGLDLLSRHRPRARLASRSYGAEASGEQRAINVLVSYA